jgi:ribose transport system substrate-binding protein
MVAVAGSIAASASLAASAPKASSFVAAAKAAVANYKAPQPFVGPTSSPKDVKGKSVTVISCDQSQEGCAQAAAGVAAAGSLLGWNVTIVDGQSSPTTQTTEMEQAIAANTNGIVLVAVDRESVAAALPLAAKAGIPVVGFADDNVVGSAPGDVFAEVNLNGNVLGKMLGDWVVADSDGKANVAMFDAPELSTIRERFAASKAVFAKCAGCRVSDVVNFPLATSGTQLPLLTNNVLSSDSSATYFWNPAGSLGSLQASTVDQSSRHGQVKVVTFDCVSTNLQQILSGTSSLAACAGTGQAQSGWAIADQMNRAFAHEKPAPTGDTIPFRLFDKTNAPSPSVGWPGDNGFRKGYEKLWGV